MPKGGLVPNHPRDRENHYRKHQNHLQGLAPLTTSQPYVGSRNSFLISEDQDICQSWLGFPASPLPNVRCHSTSSSCGEADRGQRSEKNKGKMIGTSKLPGFVVRSVDQGTVFWIERNHARYISPEPPSPPRLSNKACVCSYIFQVFTPRVRYVISRAPSPLSPRNNTC